MDELALGLDTSILVHGAYGYGHRLVARYFGVRYI